MHGIHKQSLSVARTQELSCDWLDDAGGSEMLMGLCISVTCVVELPIFAANNWILKKLGVNSVIHVTLAVCVIRMVSSIKQASPMRTCVGPCPPAHQWSSIAAVALQHSLLYAAMLEWCACTAYLKHFC